MSFQVIPASPIQLLDFDVLSLIFEDVALGDPNQGPITASHVSRFWREVALKSPRIWSNITMQLNTDSDTTIPQHLWASVYFKRSRNLPIILTINATRHFETWEKEELLQPEAYRFVSLHFIASEGSVANMLWMEMGTNMPMPSLEVFETEISGTSRIIMNRKATDDSENTGIIPPVSDSLVFWDHWKPTGLTALTLETACLWNKPDFDDIYHILANTCHTLRHFHYEGLISSTIDDTGVDRDALEFPELRSLAVFCSDNMVPLLRLLIIGKLETLIFRDFVQYPAAIPTGELMTDTTENTLTFQPDSFLFQVINQWTTIRRLEIYGIDDSVSNGTLSPLIGLSNYLESLSQLTTLVLYGIGVATSVAYTIFRHDQMVLPRLSHFLLAVTQMSSPNDNLSRYLINRQRHQLPRLQKLSINLAYIQHLTGEEHCIDILRESSEDIFVIADPENGKFIPIEEVKYY